MADEVLNSEPKHRDHDKKHRITRFVALVTLLIAIILSLVRGCGITFTDATPQPLPSICETGEPVPTGAQGEPGLSAYELWIGMGNVGTIEKFLTSLIGKPGEPGEDGKIIYYGSDGVTGPQGAIGEVGATGSTGKSAYQLWIEAGNTGNENDFLVSLIGADGSQGLAGAAGSPGAAGLSAYQVWLTIGNEGTEQDFFDSLAGVAGTAGVAGSQGLSAYDFWVADGNTGTEGEFLASLIGPQGTDGAPGACTVGETGDSAYNVWLAAGHVGSEAVFLASLVGPQGPKGDAGDQGPAGSAGFGAYGSFYDVTDQFVISAGSPQPWTYSNSAMSNGVSIQSNGNGNSRIKFASAGVYNIQFSTVFTKSNSSADYVDIWFVESGTAIPDSNTRVTIAGQSQTLAAWNFFYNCTDPNKYIEIYWYTPSTTISVDTIPAQTSPTRPLIPSVILTVDQVG
jgi:hypothetical protein